jgi:beta-carotene ketolase (CrtW type)
MNSQSGSIYQRHVRLGQASPFQFAHQFQTAIAPLAGILSTLIIVGLWGITFALAMSVDVLSVPLWLSAIAALPIILIRTFLQTGLFIVGHDAIHGSVIPDSPQGNRWIGRIVVSLYAMLPYEQLAAKHWQHHRHPGRVGDPDYHDGIHRHPLQWYWRFMNGYLDARQKWVLLIGMTILYYGFWLGFHLPPLNLVIFWVLPILLSSMQLFYFGTYLPHRQPADGYTNRHHATSSPFSKLWSFLTCYHFGYHWEHHEYPHLPWYKLPTLRDRA